jgi:hypothetical protein
VKRVWIWNSNHTTLIIQTKYTRISFKLSYYTISYCLTTVLTTVTLDVSHMISLGSLLWDSLRYHFFFCLSCYKHKGFFHSDIDTCNFPSLVQPWWIWRSMSSIIHLTIQMDSCTDQIYEILQWYEIHVSICFFIPPFFFCRMFLLLLCGLTSNVVHSCRSGRTYSSLWFDLAFIFIC